jgi:hypothetical protein
MPKQAGSIAQFFKSERSGEDMYEISHRIGLLWCVRVQSKTPTLLQ